MQVLLIIFALINSSETLADYSKEDIDFCEKVADKALREDCFGRIADGLAVKGLLGRSDFYIGGWEMGAFESKIENNTSLYAYVHSNETFRDDYGEIVIPRLYLRCHDSVIESYINVGVYLGADNVDVIMRIDDVKPSKERWGLSTDGESAFIPGDGVNLARAISISKEIAVRFLPSNVPPIEVSFDIQGGDSVAAAIHAACEKGGS
jgi:hypothetical protein